MRVKLIYLAFSLAAAAGIFYYLLSRVGLGQVVQLVRDIDRPALAVFFILSLATSFFRMWRYSLMLRLSGFAPNKAALYLVVLIRNFFSDLLPARLGTAVFVFLAATRLGIKVPAAASSWALSFVLDIMAIVPLILAAAWVAAAGGSLPVLPLVGGAVLIALVTAAVLLLLPKLCVLGAKAADRAGFLGAGVRQKSKSLLENVAEEILAVRRAGLYGRLILLSVIIRAGKYATLIVFLFALLKPLGYSWSELKIPEAFLGMCAAEMSASLPISGIGGFGLYEGTWAVTFRLLGFSPQTADITAVSHHLLTQVYGCLMGALALLVLLLPFFRCPDAAMPSPSGFEAWPRFGLKIGASLALVMGLSLLIFEAQAENRRPAAAAAERPSAAEISARSALTGVFPGRIVFDSNRSGTFGIYSINPDGSDLQTLVDTPLEEMFPDPSPDGIYIVYAAARSLARIAPAEIWIVGRDGRHSRRLAENGTFPTFSVDGLSVYFERNRQKVMAVDLASGTEREVFPAGARGFGRYQVVKPRVSPDGKQVVFTSDKPSEWHAWCADLTTGDALRLEQACEPGWFPAGNEVVLIKASGARDRSGIFRIAGTGGQMSELEDAGPPRGHEYFPSISPDGRFLLYGACRENEHAHENANYQIFVKDLRGGGGRVRITFDGFTNRWPKFLSGS